MRAILRLGLGFAAAALAAAPISLRAQSADPATNAPAPTTVGPAELKNFSINGTVTTPAPAQAQPARPQTQQPAQQQPRPTTTAPRSSAPAADRPAAQAERERPATAPAPRTDQAAAEPDRTESARPAATSEPISQTAAPGSVTVALPGADGASSAVADGPSALPVPAEPGSSRLPWILAAIAVAAGLGFLFYRRSTMATAGGPEIDAFVPSQPAAAVPDVTRVPAPVTEAPPPVEEAPAPAPALNPFGGLVSTRLRPRMDLDFRPIGCSVDDEKVVIDFEIVAQNNGSAPARAVLIEARLVNAGIEQDSEISAFFENPVGQGDRIPVVEPTKSIHLRSQLVATRDQVQVYQVAGRNVFVPLVAFNILYEWSRGQGQTSLSYLVGRDTKGEKLAPFNLDLGPRIFRTLDKRPLPIEVRH